MSVSLTIICFFDIVFHTVNYLVVSPILVKEKTNYLVVSSNAKEKAKYLVVSPMLAKEKTNWVESGVR